MSLFNKKFKDRALNKILRIHDKRMLLFILKRWKFEIPKGIIKKE